MPARAAAWAPAISPSVVHQPGEARRRYPERQRDLVAEHGAAGVDLLDVPQDRRVKLDVAERLSGAGQ